MMRNHLRLKTLSFLLVLVPVNSLFSQTFEELREEVRQLSAGLEVLIAEASLKNLTIDAATASQEVVRIFLKAAEQDRDTAHVEPLFGRLSWRKELDTERRAGELPMEELRGCMKVINHAVEELQLQLAGEIVLTAPPELARPGMTFSNGYYHLAGRPVFPSNLVWAPNKESEMSVFGRLGGGFYQMAHLGENRKVADWRLRATREAVDVERSLHAAPLSLLLGHAAPGWLVKEHPEVLQGRRHFTRYDIDSPRVRNLLRQLNNQVLPVVHEAAAETPRIHLLANEPHFATQAGGWSAGNGISEITRTGFRLWLKERYPSLDAFNRIHGKNYQSFKEVELAMPLDPALRGTAIYYDWCRFNMDRVTDWFRFLKEDIQRADPGKAPVSIKLLGYSLNASSRDAGIDVEGLVNLQDIPGGDLRVIPRGATIFGKNEDRESSEGNWQERYSYYWVEQCMMLDFVRSLRPDSLFYDSEWHGFGTVGWRHFDLERDYVRSALWLAFSHGMGAINAWLWGRDGEGKLLNQADHIGELSTQPIAVDAYSRVMKELNAHAEEVIAFAGVGRRVFIYYCEDSAIQDPSYIAGVETIYEACKLANLPVGFVTSASLSNRASERNVLLIPPTRYLSEREFSILGENQEKWAKLVVFEKENCFRMNERGQELSRKRMLETGKVLELGMSDSMEKILKGMLGGVFEDSSIQFLFRRPDSGEEVFGVLASVARDKETGDHFFLLNNVSQEAVAVELSGPEGMECEILEMLQGRDEQKKFVMKPKDVRQLRVRVSAKKKGHPSSEE